MGERVYFAYSDIDFERELVPEELFEDKIENKHTFLYVICVCNKKRLNIFNAAFTLRNYNR